MGYLDKSTITVDAILTNRGRELLADKVAGNFKITKFALADDEVDYRLYNTAHPLGDRYYGNIIESMPVLEATPDDSQLMKYKLITVSDPNNALVSRGPLGSYKIPFITLGGGGNIIAGTTQNIYLNPASSGVVNATSYIDILPTTSYGTEVAGYTLVVSDSTIITVLNTYPNAGAGTTTSVSTSTRGSVVAKGTAFRITTNTTTQKTGTVVVTAFGNNSGATFSFNLKVN